LDYVFRSFLTKSTQENAFIPLQMFYTQSKIVSADRLICNCESVSHVTKMH